MRKDVFVPEELKQKIRESLGLKESEQDKGFSQWLREAAEQRIDRENNQGWILVSDRLPECSGAYLVTTHCGTEWAIYFSSNKTFNIANYDITSNVQAWMEIPLPHKERGIK